MSVTTIWYHFGQTVHNFKAVITNFWGGFHAIMNAYMDAAGKKSQESEPIL